MSSRRSRFKVSSVTGWTINPTTTPRWLPSKLPPRTTWYVLDRANCYRVVGIWATRSQAVADQRARNRWDREHDD